MVTAGVYIIECTKNRRRYIGQSNNVWNRIKNHMQYLAGKDHTNQRWQRDYDKYGPSAFRAYVAELVENHMDRIYREQFHIDSYAKRTLYNFAPGKHKGKSFWYTDDALMCDCGGFCEIDTGCVLCGRSYDDLDPAGPPPARSPVSK